MTLCTEDLSVREAVIEKYLVKRLGEVGRQYAHCKNRVKKISGPGWRGWPDRVALFSFGVSHWLEVKRPKGGRFEPLQLRRHKDLRSFGFVVRVVNTKFLVDEYIDQLIILGPSRLAYG